MLSQKRILFVARSTTGHGIAGGMERSYEDIASALIGVGAQVALLTSHGAVLAGLPEYNEVWQLRGGRSGRYSLAWWVKSYFHKESWRKWEPDIIFSVSSAAGAIAMRPSVGKKIIAQSHGTAFAEVKSSLATPNLRELMKLPLNLGRIVREIPAYRRFARVVAIGPAVRVQLTSPPYRVPSRKITTINNGVDEKLWAFSEADRISMRSSLNIPQKSNVGVFAARLHAQKGADTAIRALKFFGTDSDKHLIVCGDGPERASLEALAIDARVSQRVHFLGMLSPADTSRALSAADVFIFPTRRKEGLPLNVLEALANGLPVVTVRNANVPQELSRHADITDGTDSSIAEAWHAKNIESRSSRLDLGFTSSGSVANYKRLMDASDPGVEGQL